MSCVVKEWLPVAKVQEEYKKKLVTADEAVKVVKSGKNRCPVFRYGAFLKERNCNAHRDTYLY